MQAGFARADITPPLGSPMMGYGDTSTRLAESVHDPLYVRALSVVHGGEEALILSLDLCFIGREESDQFKGVLGRELGLLPRQILMSSTHTHAAPPSGDYLDLEYVPTPREYQRQLEAAVVKASKEATASRREVRIEAGMGKSNLPMNRRQWRGKEVHNGPNPDGNVLDSLPVCLLKDLAGKPVCLLFTISTHVVCMRDRALSADYPGHACDLLDKKMGAICAMFLQGVGGDSRPRPLGVDASGAATKDWNWSSGWAQAELIGKTLAKEVEATLARGLKPVEPAVKSALIETFWPLQRLPREKYLEWSQPRKGAKGETLPPGLHEKWAQRWLGLHDRGQVPDQVSVLMQGVQLGKNLRLVAIEGEPLSPHGQAIEAAWPAGNGATFALGYANGEAMYLVTSPMLDEGGYEPVSYWEYGQPAPLAKGLEVARDAGLAKLKALGIA
ncbi:MAG: hypothetical protein NTW19_16725 [Planctomycetota bacterium]|nr:hypothetical protein [Planctomycetota bacterium]